MSESAFQENKRLDFENLLGILFVVVCILNIYANNIQKKYVFNQNKQYADAAKKIYTLALAITILIYYYYVQRNNRFLNEAIDNHEDYTLLRIRFIGSLLLLIGVSFILYYQVMAEKPMGSVAV